MTSNSTLFKMAGGNTHASKLHLFRQLQAFENYTVSWGQFPKICRRCGILPFVDMCCDVLGANSMCPYYFSVREDGTQQDYRSVPVWCNPPYKEMDAFFFTLERAQHADATTQAILVIPRTHFSDLEPLVARNLWTRVDYYHKSSRNFFSRPDKTSAFQGTHESVSIFGPNRRTLHSTLSFESPLVVPTAELVGRADIGLMLAHSVLSTRSSCEGGRVPC